MSLSILLVLSQACGAGHHPRDAGEPHDGGSDADSDTDLPCIEWTRTISGDYGADEARSVRFEGATLVLAGSQQVPAEGYDPPERFQAWIARLDAQGGDVWSDRVAVPDGSARGLRAEVSPLGSAFLAVEAEEPAGGGTTRVVRRMRKYSSSGMLDWDLEIDPVVFATAEDESYAAAQSESSADLLRLYDAGGVLLVETLLEDLPAGGEWISRRIARVDPIRDGVLVVGTRFVVGAEGDFSGWVALYRTTGTLIWHSVFDGEGDPAASSASDAAFAADGGVIAVGSANFGAEDESTTWVRGFDESGAERWTFLRETADAVGEVAARADGTVAVGGSLLRDGRVDGWVGVLTADGMLSWEDVFDGDGAGLDVVWSVAFAEDGSLGAAGRSYTTSGLYDLGHDAWVRKYCP